MPHRVPLPDLLARLATDPSTGLSPKEAAKRREGSTAAPLFRKPPRRYAACVRQTIREPALWMMLTVAVISLFFDRMALGLFCLLLTLGNTALCAGFLYRADRTEAAMLAYDTPLCRVLRGGRVLRVSADGLVVGDIVLICAGDIIPADCRLIRTDGFAVLEREMDAADPLRPPVRLEKDASQLAETSDGLRLSPVNMAFAGGMAESGSALAVVVAVGSETHLGGFLGHIPSAHQGKGAGYFKKAAGFLSVYNLLLLCFVVPLTAVGIFTAGETYEFLDIFLSGLALATLTLTEHLLARGIHLAAATRRAAALDRDGENTAEIKSAAAAETLTAMTDLLLVGTAALHDGERHPETFRIGERTYRCDHPDADDEAKALAECLYLYCEASAAFPSIGTDGNGGFAGLATAFCEWAEVDVEALRVKIKEIRPHGRGIAGIFPTAYGNRRVVVRLTHDFGEAVACSHIRDGGLNRPMDNEWKDILYNACREAVRQGRTPLFVLTDSEGESTVRAMLAYAPMAGRKTAGGIQNLERAGIRVTAFLRDESNQNTRVLADCGLTDTHPADRSDTGEPRTPAAQRIDDGCRAFEGCSTAYISDCIADLKVAGRTVGVLSVDGADVSLLAEADIAFTCAPSLYAAAESGTHTAVPVSPESASAADGTPDSAVADDCSRRAAHVVVRRTSATGGGMLGVLRALQAADCFRNALDRTIRYLLISQTVRIVMTILPLCLGLSIAAAPALLISGLLTDLLVMTAFLNLPLRPTPAPRREPTADIVRSLRDHIPEMIAAAVGAVLPWVVAGIAALCDVDFGGDLLYYGLLCTAWLQLAVFRTDKLPRRDSSVFFATLALVLICVGALAASLVGGLRPLWSICLPLVAPLGYVAARAIALAVKK